MYHDRAREKQTTVVLNLLKTKIKKMRKSPSAKNLTIAFQALDKAAKRNIIHKNKASRLKSRLSKLLKK